ncbi:MAG: hypothetical protein ACJ798_19365 [Phenylobacterium sp.]
MIVAMLAATVLLADSTAALQATATQPAATAAAPAKKAGDQANLVCKSEPVLGSRMPVKRCRTSDQAKADKQAAREELERAQGAMAQNPH